LYTDNTFKKTLVPMTMTFHKHISYKLRMFHKDMLLNWYCPQL